MPSKRPRWRPSNGGGNTGNYPSSSITPNYEPSLASQQQQPTKWPLPRACIQTSTENIKLPAPKSHRHLESEDFRQRRPGQNRRATQGPHHQKFGGQVHQQDKEGVYRVRNRNKKTLLAHIKQEWVKSTIHKRTKALATYHAPRDQVTNIMTYEQSLTKAQEKCVDMGIVCDASGKVQIYVE